MQDPIKPLTGAQRVRLRPAVVFGDDGIDGAMCGLDTLLGVMAAECHHGYASRLILTSCRDGAIEIHDNGRGLYLGSGKAEDDAVWKSKLCEIYCGSAYPEQIDRSFEYSYFEETGKTPCQPYESEPYDEFSLCAVQYVSEFMDVTVCRDGLELALHFEKGENVGGISAKASDAPSGTKIRFQLDPEVFTCVDIPESHLMEALRKLAVLNPNCSVIYRKETGCGVQSVDFCFPEGFGSLLTKRCAGILSSAIYTAEIKAAGKDRYNRPEYGARIEVALCFSRDNGCTEVFHNRRSLSRGGKHIERILSAVQDRLEWQLDCPIDRQTLARHLCLTVSTTTTRYGTVWSDGTGTRIENTMICDMAHDCIRDDFSHYIKTHRADIRKIFGIENG